MRLFSRSRVTSAIARAAQVVDDRGRRAKELDPDGDFKRPLKPKIEIKWEYDR